MIFTTVLGIDSVQVIYISFCLFLWSLGGRAKFVKNTFLMTENVATIFAFKGKEMNSFPFSDIFAQTRRAP